MTGTIRLSACERVVVAVSTGHDSQTIWEAAKLAQLTQSELFAVFIENVDLINLAAIPFSVEITTRGEKLPLETQNLERDMKALAESTRKEIGRIANSMGIPWRLEVVRDEPKVALRRAAGERDILVATEGDDERLGQTEDEHGLGSLVVSERPGRTDGPIVVVTAPGERGDWVVHQAAEIAHQRDRSLFVLCMNCPTQGVDHYKQIARNEMGDNGRVDFRTIERFDVAEVATEIHRLGSRLVVASPIPEMGLNRNTAGRLANLLGVPVLLLR